MYIPKKTILVLAALLTSVSQARADEKLYNNLQDISVTVKAGASEGSGVIITRKVQTSPNKTEEVNFVWTAGHVIDGLRSVRTIITTEGQRQIVEFRDAQIVKEHIENGRKVGESVMYAKVIKYSDAEDGEDLALLMVRKKGFLTVGAKFTDDSPVDIGTELYHVGSLLGQVGSNSMTRGIMSQVGRVLNLGTGDGVVFDQTTVNAFPGSSGGGVFLSERSGDKAGQYVGMLVRGAGETFNLIVPVRRMRRWAEKEDVRWALDTDVKVPSLDDVFSLPVQGSLAGKKASATKSITPDSKKFPTLPVSAINTQIQKPSTVIQVK